MPFMTVVPPVVEQLTTRMELQVRVEMCPINHYYLWREYREGCTGYCGQVATSACKVEMPRCSARNCAAVSQQFCESSRNKWCIADLRRVWRPSCTGAGGRTRCSPPCPPSPCILGTPHSCNMIALIIMTSLEGKLPISNKHLAKVKRKKFLQRQTMQCH